MKYKLQETHQLMREYMDVEQKKNARRPIMIVVGMNQAIEVAKKC